MAALRRLAIALTGLVLCSPAPAIDYVLSDQASCLGLPWSASWDSGLSTCTAGINVELSATDTMTIQSPARLVVPIGLSLDNNGGVLSIPLGGRLSISGAMNNNAGASVQNSGFWTLRDGALLTNLATASIVNDNQLLISSGAFDNAGTFDSNATLNINNGQSLTNSGTLNNTATLTVQGTLTNTGTINNLGVIDIDCGIFDNTGTLTGNPVLMAWCWTGAVDAFWGTDGNWNLNGTPPSDAEVTIPSGTPSPHVNASLALSGSVEVAINTLIVDAGATLTNSGTISTFTTVPGNSVLQVDGAFVNDGTLLNGNRLTNNGTVTNNSLVGPSSGTGQLYNSGTFTNAASGNFQGGLENFASGLIDNRGHFELNRSQNDNAGFIDNASGSLLKIDNVLSNLAGGELHNAGTVNVTDDLSNPGRLENSAFGLISNEAGGILATIAEDSSILNDGRIDNDGTLSNSGIVQNNGQICGAGSVTGNPVDGNTPGVGCVELVFTSGFEEAP